MHAYVEELAKHVGQEVTVKGWLYNRRSSGKIQFLQVRDGTGIVQCILTEDAADKSRFEACEHLPQESSLVVTGVCRADKRAPGGFELTAREVSIVQVAQNYPISLQSHGIGFLMEHRHLWLRSRKQVATLRIRATVIKAIRDFFDSRGFILADSPILTPAACEGTSTLFEVGYFDDKAYLSQSGQLYAEAAAMALGKVYCFGPTFRAERSKTRRHLTEFWMVEPEVAFADLDDVMRLAEEFISFIVSTTLGRCKEELKVLERDTVRLEKVTPPFPRISYDEAIKMLTESGHDIKWGGDFGAPEETAISDRYEKPVMVHRYPMACKAFYMKTDPQDERLALCVDVIAPEGVGEIIGGSQREDRLEVLEKRIAENNLSKESLEWYLDLRRFGSVPHGGFGLGLERTVAWICGTEHIRETIPFPRMLYRIYP
ncbi:MAG: asparagine--tRNA ligase [Planctomycetota bacterium]|nr:asparagine--tRNA ligase [Planctomycetota bacterium]